MTRLDILLQNSLRLNEVKVLVEVYKDKDVQQFAIDLNRDGQLFKRGVNIEDEVIGVYSSRTQRINPKKKAGTPYTLKDTGDFFKTFKFKLSRDGSFTIFANDVKGDDLLTEKYPDILGLTVKSVDELIKKILPLVIRETREALFIGIS